MNNSKKVLLTGDTPTGRLHVGHYVGTLENRVKLQDEYDTYILSADLHALTTLSKSPQIIGEHTRQVLLDNLAVGLDPKKVTFFVESAIPEIYELAALFSMYVTHSEALRNPTVKDEIKMKSLGDVFSLGFVNYPIYQVADILCVKGELVPVGVDQLAHLEQSREIARAVNTAAGQEIFPEPKPLVGRIGKLVGTDGNPKMGKSLGNTIYLSESKEEIERKIKGMYTDPKRVHVSDRGTVKGNPMFIYLDVFGTDQDHPTIKDFKEKYVEGKVGDVEIKQYLIGVMERLIDPFREKRKYYEENPKLVDKIIKDGNIKTREIVVKTLDEVKTSLKFFS